ncbi:MAG: DUF4007 family protein [Gemmatimonadota bacterium]|nr:DUF4007 family protein [Gemmatimonadota bacterium]MDE2863512.1 DUF4007 family protein [Gemmatimonadota bacterium]
MRFGGHQTFAIRDGWLFKGLRLVVENPERLGDPDLADWLGVGRNMAKAIHHWLVATGLAKKDLSRGSRSRVLRPTEFGATIWHRDRYFLLPGTWWAIHVRLVNCPEYAYSWHWFFNRFGAVRFERPVCVEALRRHLAASGSRMPAQRTLERDIACLLRSYAVSVPTKLGDPEDAMDCPLGELGLLVHSCQTGFHHMNRRPKPIPHEIFGYALASGQELGRGANLVTSPDRSLTELAYSLNAPGRIFSLTAESLYELVSGYESQGFVRLDGNAGERILRVDLRPGLDWLRAYYDSIDLTEAA